MPILNWSSTILGYPAHARSAVPVIALSHMNTHEALRFAESIGLFTGWIITEQPQPLLQGLLEGKPSWVSLAEMFVERRIVKTEGMVSGSVVFTAAVPADGDPLLTALSSNGQKSLATHGCWQWIMNAPIGADLVISKSTPYCAGLYPAIHPVYAGKMCVLPLT